MGRKGKMGKKNITKNALLLLDQNQTKLMDRLIMEVTIAVIMIDQAITIITKTITDLIIIEAIEEASTIEIIEVSKIEAMEITIKDGEEVEEVTEKINGEIEAITEVEVVVIETIEIIGTIIEIILMKTQGRVIKDMRRQEILGPVTTMKIHPDQTLRIQSQVMHMRKSQREEILRMTQGRKER